MPKRATGEMNIRDLEVYGDSMLIIRQAQGERAGLRKDKRSVYLGKEPHGAVSVQEFVSFVSEVLSCVINQDIHNR